MQVPVESRGRWLNELALALYEARELVQDLHVEGNQRLLAQELSDRIEAARFEVRSLSRAFDARAGSVSEARGKFEQMPRLWMVAGA